MNEKDASEIYAFANNKSIQHQRIICKLEAFRIVNYYMSDENFNIVWVELFTFIDQWIEDKDSITIVGSSIFAALEESYLRIAQDQLIEIICKCLRSNKRRFFDEVFRLIRKCVSLDNASPENVTALLEAIINIVRNPDERTQIHSLEAALFTLRKKNKVLTEELDNVIAKEMPTFYNDTYRLETSIEEDADMPTFLESYIAQVCSDNDNQGKNGQYFGRVNQPHITIKNILVKLMDNDNVYIKNSILRKIYLIEEIDMATHRYIIQKGTVDTNYVVRLVANEIKREGLRFLP